MPHRVVEADFVTLENTGLVHIAPGHGWDDYLVGVRECLPFLCPVDEAGVFTAEAGAFAGRPIREANLDVLEALGDHLLARAEVVHRYGHCWRCKTPIIFRATAQWFLRIPDVKEQMLDVIAKVTLVPGVGRLAPGSTTGSRTPATGASRASATGASRSRSGSARPAAPGGSWAPSPSSRRSRARPSPTRTAPSWTR